MNKLLNKFGTISVKRGDVETVYPVGFWAWCVTAPLLAAKVLLDFSIPWWVVFLAPGLFYGSVAAFALMILGIMYLGQAMGHGKVTWRKKDV